MTRLTLLAAVAFLPLFRDMTHGTITASLLPYRRGPLAAYGRGLRAVATCCYSRLPPP